MLSREITEQTVLLVAWLRSVEARTDELRAVNDTIERALAQMEQKGLGENG